MSKKLQLSKAEFEDYLDQVCKKLTAESIRKPFKTSKDLENRSRELFQALLRHHGVEIAISPPAQDFPDIIIGRFGVEVKYTEKNTWRSVANSISEGSRDEGVTQIYILFGKMGGDSPEVRWAKYDDCVIHVRTSHVPRFEVEMSERESLFSKIGISYLDFSKLPMEEKMIHVRKYVRGRIRPGEYYWWVENQSAQQAQVKLFFQLEKSERLKLFAESILLFPNLLSPRGVPANDFKFSLHLLETHNVLCPSIGMLYGSDFSSTSHEERPIDEVIQSKILEAEEILRKMAHEVPNEFFIQHWGRSVMPDDRISEWFKIVDSLIRGWEPSKLLVKLKKAA